MFRLPDIDLVVEVSQVSPLLCPVFSDYSQDIGDESVKLTINTHFSTIIQYFASNGYRSTLYFILARNGSHKGDTSGK